MKRRTFVWAVLVGCAVGWMGMMPGAWAQNALDPAPEGSFTLVVIPDTQGYRGRDTKTEPESTDDVTNPVFEAHTRWIADHIETQRIAFVSHVGDIVDKNTHDQWAVARRCMDRLHGRAPYGISAGNHDMASDGNSSLFQQYFPASRFEDFAWYGGSFPGNPERPHISGNNANSYQLFSAEGLDFVFFHLECNAPDDVLAWADDILTRYADRLAIVTTHMDLGPIQRPETGEGFFNDPKGRMQWTKRHGARGNSPQQMWDKCFRKHENLLAIFSGDQSRTTAMYQRSTGDRGNVVHALLSDYTSSGPLRLYRFLPSEQAIQVMTFDTTRGERVAETRIVPERDMHQFTIRDARISRK